MMKLEGEKKLFKDKICTHKTGYIVWKKNPIFIFGNSQLKT